MTLIFRVILAATLFGYAFMVPGEAASPAPVAPVAAPALKALVIHPASEVKLKGLVWKARPLVIFADNPADPAFRQQMQYLRGSGAALAARDVMVIIDTDPAAMTAIREKLRPIGFAVVLIDKTGNVAQRRPLPWKTREIVAIIDSLPIRRAEMLRHQ